MAPRIYPLEVDMLSDIKVRTAKPREKLYKLFDERGLYVGRAGQADAQTPAGPDHNATFVRRFASWLPRF